MTPRTAGFPALSHPSASPTPIAYALRISYDGSAFAGFQWQRGRDTVQGALEEALGRAFGERLAVAGASRTDAGVHAASQIVSFRVHRRVDPEELGRALGALIGPRIFVRAAAVAHPSFHARWSAVGKTYVYRVSARPSDARDRTPIGHPRLLHGAELGVDPERARAALARMVGRGGFGGVCGRACRRELELRRAELATPAAGEWELWFEGPAFGRFMVRNLAGLAIAVGMGLFPLDALPPALHCERQLRGLRAPPQGLTLCDVVYPAAMAPFGPPR